LLNVQILHTATKRRLPRSTFYWSYFITQQWAHTDYNLLILLNDNFNNFVNLAKTPWRWCTCIETCRTTYKVYKMHGMYINIQQKLDLFSTQQSIHITCRENFMFGLIHKKWHFLTYSASNFYMWKKVTFIHR
jgi:hypothetical protein